MNSHGGDITLASVRVANIVLTAASSAVVARALGPHKYGVFAAGTAVATLVVIGRAFGADALYLRGSIDARAFQRRALYATGINAGLVVLAAGAWPGLSWAGRACALLMGTAWSLSCARLPWQIVPARQLQFARRSRRELLAAVLSLGGVMAFAGVFKEPALAAAGLLTGAVVTTTISWRPSVRRECDAVATTPGDASIKAGLSFAAMEGLFIAYFTIDGAMIAAMRPAVDAGMYRVAYAFVLAAAVVPFALNADVLRVRLWHLDEPARTQALRRAVRLTGMAAVAVTLAFELLGGVGERLFFGPRFVAAIPIIRLLGAAMPFHYANSVLSNLLVGEGRVAIVIRVQCLLVAINVVGNLFLIPTHGPQGAAVMTAITEALGTALYAVVVRRSSRLQIDHSRDGVVRSPA